MKIAKILKKSLESNISDIILSSCNKPAFKIYGDIVHLDDFEEIWPEEMQEEIFSTMTEKQQEKFKVEKELDYSIELKWFSRFRVNAFYSKNWPWAVLRPIKTEIPKFEELLLPTTLLKLADKKNGLILVTGWVGSWKSTTMSSLIDYISRNKARHIITVEDPIETIFKNGKSIIEQREIWTSTNSFANGLKYALRQASDVIMIWEMRDIETFRLALRAAETGNLVFATLHTSWAARTISRIIDMFPSEEKDYIRAQLSSSLLWIIWQDLLKSKDWEGRVLATEFLVNNTSISNMIRKWEIHQIKGAIETWWKDYWMYTMDKCLERLKKNNLI